MYSSNIGQGEQEADGRIILHVARQGYHNTRGHHSISRGRAGVLFGINNFG